MMSKAFASAYIFILEAFQYTKAHFNGLDIVINNAEIMNDKFWELEVDVNLVIKFNKRTKLVLQRPT